MEHYLQTSKNLKRGERRAGSVEPVSRSGSVDRHLSVENKNKDESETKKKKVAYKTEIIDLTAKLEDIQKDNNIIHTDLVNQLEDIKKSIESLKNTDEQNNSTKLKIKLDNFINSYNENELAHSEELKHLSQEINKLNQRLNDVEEVL
jgi:phage-related minor tail protein